MRWIETASGSILLAACDSKKRPMVACRRAAALFWLLSPRSAMTTPSISIPSTPVKKGRVRTAEGANDNQPRIRFGH